MNFRTTVFTGVEPNMTTADIVTACRFLLLPRLWKKWQSGNAIEKVESWLRDYFQTQQVYTIDSGRSALSLALKAGGVTTGDEVLLQGFTCVVVPGAILAVGATPIYVDVAGDFTMDPAEVEKHITPKTKAIIIQHTFGISAKTIELITIAKKHALFIIEDCAHSLGVKQNGILTGTMGDIGMFSFGSDKVASCVRGGALIAKSPDIAEKIEEQISRLPLMPRFTILTHLIHYPIFFVGKKLYHLGLGKLLFYICKKLHITSWIMETPEKRGKQILPYPTRMSNALATILLQQLSGLDTHNEHRRVIAQSYAQAFSKQFVPCQPEQYPEANFLRFPLLVFEPQKLFALAKQQGIQLGDWYTTPIGPKDTDLIAVRYQKGSCPKAEALSKSVINLPTHRHIGKKELDRVIACVKAHGV